MLPKFGFTILVGIFALCAATKEESSLIQRAHKGIEKVLNFILDDYEQVNLDCLFELVLGYVFLENISQIKINQHDLDRINSYKEQINKIASLVKPILLKDGNSNQLFIERLLDEKLWLRDVKFRRNKINSTYSVRSDFQNADEFVKFEAIESFQEYHSDDCFVDILQSGSSDIPHTCKLNNWCRTNMVYSTNIKPAYIVTHRLLLLQIAKSQNCYFEESIYDNFIHSYCSYIYWEIRQNKKYRFIPRFDDLLMEQVTLCGLEGIEEFTDEDLLEYILSIQKEQGCFAVDYPERRRRKRTANVIKYGCADHATGLGASSISLFLLSLYQKGESL